MIRTAIHFPGTCNEALTFYEGIFETSDKQIDFNHEAPPDSGIDYTEETKNKVMHAGMTICGTPMNFSDMDEPAVVGNMYCLNVFLDTEAKVAEAYGKIRVGGTVVVELGPQFFSRMYGSVVDRFGVKWQIICG